MSLDHDRRHARFIVIAVGIGIICWAVAVVDTARDPLLMWVDKTITSYQRHGLDSQSETDRLRHAGADKVLVLIQDNRALHDMSTSAHLNTEVNHLTTAD